MTTSTLTAPERPDTADAPAPTQVVPAGLRVRRDPTTRATFVQVTWSDGTGYPIRIPQLGDLLRGNLDAKRPWNLLPPYARLGGIPERPSVTVRMSLGRRRAEAFFTAAGPRTLAFALGTLQEQHTPSAAFTSLPDLLSAMARAASGAAHERALRRRRRVTPEVFTARFEDPATATVALHWPLGDVRYTLTAGHLAVLHRAARTAGFELAIAPYQVGPDPAAPWVRVTWTRADGEHLTATFADRDATGTLLLTGAHLTLPGSSDPHVIVGAGDPLDLSALPARLAVTR